MPTKDRVRFVKEFHGAMAHGHQGITKTLSRLSRGYYFLGIRKVVKDVVSLYNTYIRNKATYYTPYGLIKSLETLPRLWKSITLDFVVGLLLSRDPITGLEYDSICVVTDRFTKYAYIVLVLGTMDADTIA